MTTNTIEATWDSLERSLDDCEQLLAKLEAKPGKVTTNTLPS